MSLAAEATARAAVTQPNLAARGHGKRFRVLAFNAGLTLAFLDAAIQIPGIELAIREIRERLDITYLDQPFGLSFAAVCLNLVLLYAAGAYGRGCAMARFGAMARLPVILMLSSGLLFLLLHFVLPLVAPDAADVRSNSRTILFVLVCFSLSLGAAVISRGIVTIMARRGYFHRRMLVVGTGSRARHLGELLHHDRFAASTALTFVDESVIAAISTEPGETASGLAGNVMPIGGRSLEQLVEESRADEIVVAVDERRGLSIARLLTCKADGIPVTSYASFLERETERVDLRWLEQSWLVYSGGFQMSGLDRLLKRLTDIVVSLAGLTITSIPLAFSMAAVWLETGRPIFFCQRRVTEGGRTFWLIKLRTMVADAERSGPKWAGVKDSRVTRIGAVLRRYRLDEIPQFVNVLRGDMSLVGPRPERPEFIEKLVEAIPLYNLRHTVKGGITGWAQVNYPYGASVDDARAKLEYDLYYIKNYRFLLDLVTMLQTLRVLIWAEGAR